jgi:hypothetical protein
MTAASDAESMDEAVSPDRKSRKAPVDSDDEEFMPGGDGRSCCELHAQSYMTVF